MTEEQVVITQGYKGLKGWAENDQKDLDYKRVETLEDLRVLHEEIKKSKRVAVDIEARSLDPYMATYERIGYPLVSIQFCTEPKKAWFLPIAHVDFLAEDNPQGFFWPSDQYEQVLVILNDILTNPAYLVIGHNFKFDSKFILKFLGIKPKLNFDTMLGFGLFQDTSNGLKKLAWEYTDLGGYEEEQEKFTKSLPVSQQYDMFYYPNTNLTIYGCADADVTFRLFLILNERMKKDPQLLKLFGILIRASKAFLDIENDGIKINTDYLKELEVDIKLEMANLEANFIKEAYTEISMMESEMLKGAVGKKGQILKNKIVKFNIASSDHINHLFFEKLKMPISDKHISKKTGKPSVGRPVLNALKEKYPIAGILLNHRILAKQLSSFIESYPAFIDENTRIHPDYSLIKYFNETEGVEQGTVTGRLSCRNPNLQQVPSRGDGKKIKKLFIPDHPEHFLCDADYAGIELRVMAMHCQDDKMKTFFNSGRGDFHRYVASRINGIKEEDITDAQRSVAKTCVFAVLYGAGPHKIADTTGMTYTDATKFIQDYFMLFPNLKLWINRQKSFAMKNLYVKSLFGRVRRLPEAESQNENLRERALRQAVNSIIQSDASDLTLYSLGRIHKYLDEFKHKDPNKPTRIRGSVHDSILLSIHSDDIEEIVSHIKFNILEKPGLDFIQKRAILLRADVSIGKNWGEQEDLIFE